MTYIVQSNINVIGEGRRMLVLGRLNELGVDRYEVEEKLSK